MCRDPEVKLCFPRGWVRARVCTGLLQRCFQPPYSVCSQVTWLQGAANPWVPSQTGRLVPLAETSPGPSCFNSIFIPVGVDVFGGCSRNSSNSLFDGSLQQVRCSSQVHFTLWDSSKDPFHLIHEKTVSKKLEHSFKNHALPTHDSNIDRTSVFLLNTFISTLVVGGTIQEPARDPAVLRPVGLCCRGDHTLRCSGIQGWFPAWRQLPWRAATLAGAIALVRNKSLPYLVTKILFITYSAT